MTRICPSARTYLYYINKPLKHEFACDLAKIFMWSNPSIDQVLNMSLTYGNWDVCPSMNNIRGSMAIQSV